MGLPALYVIGTIPPPDSPSTSSLIHLWPVVRCRAYWSGPSQVIVVAWPKTTCPTSTVMLGAGVDRRRHGGRLRLVHVAAPRPVAQELKVAEVRAVAVEGRDHLDGRAGAGVPARG